MRNGDAAPPQPRPQPPPSLQRLLEQLEAANGGAPDAEARRALAELSRVMSESERAVGAGDARRSTTAAAAAAATTEVVVVAETAAAVAEGAEAQAAAAAAAAEALAARVSVLESRIEELAPETTAIVAEALAETIKGAGDGGEDS